MFLATYVYCRKDETASGGKICKTITRIITTDSYEYAIRSIHEEHKKQGETISGHIEMVKSLP